MWITANFISTLYSYNLINFKVHTYIRIMATQTVIKITNENHPQVCNTDQYYPNEQQKKHQSTLETIPSALSDHDVTACVWKMNNTKYKRITIRCRDYTKIKIWMKSTTHFWIQTGTILYAKTSSSLVAWEEWQKFSKIRLTRLHLS